MAAPTSPTLASITNEALKKAGYPSPNVPTACSKERRTEWMEEVKHDIWSLMKKPKSLHTTSVLITTQNQARYTYPTDYSSDLTLNALHGNVTGTAQAGASGSITLAAADTSAQATVEARKILIYSGTAKGSMSQCTAYDTTTKVATMAPDFNTAPDNTSLYMIIDQNISLKQTSLFDFDAESSPTSRGTAVSFHAYW